MQLSEIIKMHNDWIIFSCLGSKNLESDPKVDLFLQDIFERYLKEHKRCAYRVDVYILERQLNVSVSFAFPDWDGPMKQIAIPDYMDEEGISISLRKMGFLQSDDYFQYMHLL